VSGQVRFVVDKVALGQVFSEYFGFPCQSSFHQILHPHNHPGQVRLASGRRAKWTQFGLHPPPCVNLKKKHWMVTLTMLVVLIHSQRDNNVAFFYLMGFTSVTLWFISLYTVFVNLLNFEFLEVYLKIL
jgi:hypothetical protein